MVILLVLKLSIRSMRVSLDALSTDDKDLSMALPPLELPTIGKAAPAFTALNQNEEKISLSSLKGKKVVLYFYPKAMTPGCTTQACGIRDTQKDFDKRNTVVLGISPDAPSRLVKFIEKQQLNFDLLSDEDHSIAEKYGVWALKKFMGKEYVGIHRLTFVIDEKGKLTHIIEKVKTKTHHDDLLTIIDSM
jgi:peroxiredoxin Q/BCP